MGTQSTSLQSKLQLVLTPSLLQRHYTHQGFHPMPKSTAQTSPPSAPSSPRTPQTLKTQSCATRTTASSPSPTPSSLSPKSAPPLSLISHSSLPNPAFLSPDHLGTWRKLTPRSYTQARSSLDILKQKMRSPYQMFRHRGSSSRIGHRQVRSARCAGIGTSLCLLRFCSRTLYTSPGGWMMGVWC